MFNFSLVLPVFRDLLCVLLSLGAAEVFIASAVVKLFMSNRKIPGLFTVISSVLQDLLRRDSFFLDACGETLLCNSLLFFKCRLLENVLRLLRNPLKMHVTLTIYRNIRQTISSMMISSE